MTPEEFREQGHRLIDWIADYREGLAGLPVMARTEPGAIKARLPGSAPDRPEPFEAILGDLDRILRVGPGIGPAPMARCGGRPVVVCLGIRRPPLRTRSPAMIEDRRQFTRQALQSLTALALIDGLAAHRLFGDDVRPTVDAWLKQLDAISRDVKDQRIKDVEFQRALEGLYRQVDLPSLLKTLDFDRLARGVKYKDRGETSLPVDFKGVAGLPTKLVWGRQVFAMKRGRSVVPHGHDKMATGFLVLNGTLRGRHWDRVEDGDDHYLIRPTVDRSFAPGEFSTVSDHKDNVHWFTAESDDAFLFNVHVIGINPGNANVAGRVYVDPMGEKVAGGLIKAPKITHTEATRLYG